MSNAAAPPVISAMNFVAPGEAKPRSFIARPEVEADVRRPSIERHDVAIFDGRPRIDALSLDVEGVSVLRQASAVADFYDPAEVERVYYPEVADLVMAATGAGRVHVFDHNVRNATRADARRDNARKPVLYAHNDYTEISGPQRLRELLPNEAEDLLRRRFAFINVWRPIRGPVKDTPLAVCDARTIRFEDFIATDLVYEDRTGEVYSIRHNPDQRWLYVSDMRADEVMFLKCFDSKRDGRARYTAHSAFKHPDSPPGWPARESIEVRAIALFDSP